MWGYPASTADASEGHLLSDEDDIQYTDVCFLLKGIPESY